MCLAKMLVAACCVLSVQHEQHIYCRYMDLYYTTHKTCLQNCLYCIQKNCTHITYTKLLVSAKLNKVSLELTFNKENYSCREVGYQNLVNKLENYENNEVNANPEKILLCRTFFFRKIINH